MNNLPLTSFNDTLPANLLARVSHIRILVAVVPFALLVLFLYFILQMLKVFFTAAALRENSRYVLFAYLMINDTVYLCVCVVLLLFAVLAVAVPTLACYLIVLITNSTYSNTLNGLAAMAIERYVAICFPLRHAEMCRVGRSLVGICVISVIGLLPCLLDFFVLVSMVNPNFFFQRIMCSQEDLYVHPLQSVLGLVYHTGLFTTVTLVIVFTYIKIVLEATKINADKSASSKAAKTVILHAVQLVLCITSFTYPITETYFINQFPLIRFLNLFLFTILPRFLSPLIYGLRDEAFKNHVKICLPCCVHKTNTLSLKL